MHASHFGRRACLACGAASLVVRSAAAAPEPGPAADPARIALLVTANHILFDQGVVDGFGHVSMRHDKRADRFLLARNIAPGLVTTADILEFDFAGDPIGSAGVPLYLERFIHAEIFRARPDVTAVVHSHSPGIIPFGVAQGAKLRPVYHMAGFLGADGPPIFDIRGVAGEGTDLLIRSSALGAELAKTLGAAPLVLMRGHGATIVGSTLPQAVYRAVYAEADAKLESESLRLGAVNFLTPGEAEATARTLDGQVNRAWDLWARKAEAQR
jgi:HCOMODA/2-hydroxy-3-carboxy-muconic semialdehyde decarboxylase